jgi:hypothetical protein
MLLECDATVRAKPWGTQSLAQKPVAVRAAPVPDREERAEYDNGDGEDCKWRREVRVLTGREQKNRGSPEDDEDARHKKTSGSALPKQPGDVRRGQDLLVFSWHLSLRAA